jgi:hypothetical protein
MTQATSIFTTLPRDPQPRNLLNKAVLLVVIYLPVYAVGLASGAAIGTLISLVVS